VTKLVEIVFVRCHFKASGDRRVLHHLTSRDAYRSETVRAVVVQAEVVKRQHRRHHGLGTKRGVQSAS
jgi:hypothetical protein